MDVLTRTTPQDTPSSMTRPGRVTRTATWSATHPWRALALWVAFVVAALALGASVPTTSTTDADRRVGESGRADAMVVAAGLREAPTESVLLTSRSGPLDRADAAAAARELRSRAGALGEVGAVTPPVASRDGRSLLVQVTLRRQRDEPDVVPLQRVTAQVAAAHPGLRVEQTGEASLDAAVGDRVGEDLGRAERLSLPITLVILLVAFGAFVAAGVPVLLALSGVLATIGLYAPISHLVHADDSVSSMVLLIGMAVGVDYSLFYLTRARAERRKGTGAHDAVRVAAATSGHAIVVSGAAVVVSMAGLYLADDATFASLATGAILVVAVSVVGSLTVLPALMVVLGRWMDRPRVPLLWRLGRRAARRPGAQGLVARVTGPVLRRPVAALVLGTVAVLALAAPALGMRLREPGVEALPADIAQVRTLQRVQAAFPSTGETLEVVARSTPSALPATVRALRSLRQDAEGVPGLDAGDGSAVRSSRATGTAVLTMTSTSGSGSAQERRVLDRVRGSLAPSHLATVSTWAVGGDVASGVDFAQHQSSRLPWVVGSVLMVTALMVGLTFRSVVVALVTSVLNLASVGAAFGVLTLVFQHRWAEGLLDFRSTGSVVDWIPLFLFVVLVGLSMDYHVFVLSRVREGVARGLSAREAVAEGVRGTAGIVTSAAVVMVSVFAIFATLSLLQMKQLGVGLAVSVLVDATLVRVVLLPALLVLLGDRVWPRAAISPAAEPQLVAATNRA